MRKIKYIVILLLAFLLPLIASCGAAAPNMDGGFDNSDNSVVEETTRKIYYTVSYNIVSEKYNEIKNNINSKIVEYSGYIQDSTDSSDYAEYVYRVPTNKLNEMLDYIDSLGNSVSNKKISSTDITTDYSEAEARKEVLVASRSAYINMLENATTIADIIEIQDKLDEIDAEILTLEKELAGYDNLVDYSTITITYKTKVNNNPFENYGEYLLGVITVIGVIILYALPFVLISGIILGTIFGVKSYKRKRNNK